MSRTLPVPVGDPPTKVIFEGVAPGSTAARRLFSQRVGDIEHFHAKARQSRGDLPSYYTQQSFPGGDQMRYTYNNGLETIYVKLTPHELQRPRQPEPEPTAPWDTALIELELTGMSETGAVFSAFVEANGEIKASAIDDGAGNGDPRAYLLYAISGDSIADNPGGTVYSSLKVDLTRLRGSKSVKIELYGNIKVYYTEGDGEIISSFPGITTSRIVLGHKGDTPEHTIGNVPILGDWAITDDSLVDGNVPENFPELADYAVLPATDLYNGTTVLGSHRLGEGSIQDTYGNYHQPDDSYEWQWALLSLYGLVPDDFMTEFGPSTDTTVTEYWDDAHTILKSTVRTGSSYYNYDFTVLSDGPHCPDPPHVDGVTYTKYFQGFCLGTYYVPVRSTTSEPHYIDRTAKVSGALFRGDPFDASSHYNTPSVSNDCWRWETQANYPQRAKLAEVGSAPMHAIDTPEDTSEANHYGMPHLGTVELDLEHGVVTWHAA